MRTPDPNIYSDVIFAVICLWYFLEYILLRICEQQILIYLFTYLSPSCLAIHQLTKSHAKHFHHIYKHNRLTINTCSKLKYIYTHTRWMTRGLALVEKKMVKVRLRAHVRS